MKIEDLYLDKMMSITEISRYTGIALSTIRFRLLKLGVLRSREEAIKIAAKAGKLGSGNRGKHLTFTEEWKKNISIGKLLHGEKNAIGISINPNGYVQYTRGENKGRCVHVVLMEGKIGRRIFAYEVVHHKDGDKQNNEIDNLELMSRSKHTSYHAKLNFIHRKRKENGQFE